MTSSNGNIFRVTGPLCGDFTGPGEFPTQRPVTRSFDVFFDLRLNKRLSKQPWGWWLWRHCNDGIECVVWKSPCVSQGRILTVSRNDWKLKNICWKQLNSERFKDIHMFYQHECICIPVLICHTFLSDLDSRDDCHQWLGSDIISCDQ